MNKFFFYSVSDPIFISWFTWPGRMKHGVSVQKRQFTYKSNALMNCTLCWVISHQKFVPLKKKSEAHEKQWHQIHAVDLSITVLKPTNQWKAKTNNKQVDAITKPVYKECTAVQWLHIHTHGRNEKSVRVVFLNTNRIESTRNGIESKRVEIEIRLCQRRWRKANTMFALNMNTTTNKLIFRCNPISFLAVFLFLPNIFERLRCFPSDEIPIQTNASFPILFYYSFHFSKLNLV